jgi:NADPH:quinone reductase-like Zn-dependent oxidoreductase
MVRIMAGMFKPKNNILGIDFAGKVEVVGSGVQQFKPGDEVFGTCDHGAFAEFVCAKQNSIQPKPGSITFKQGAAVSAAASIALQGLRDKGHIQAGHKVLINGASGGVGTFAVQIAKAYGAEVTGVCSARNIDRVHSIGADHMIDYTSQDFTQSREDYDLIFDVVAKRSFSDCKRVLTPKGIYVTTAFSPGKAFVEFWTAVRGGKRMAPITPVPPNQEDLRFLKDLIESGKVTPVIDRQFTLSKLPEALLYLSKGHAQGKIIITI